MGDVTVYHGTNTILFERMKRNGTIGVSFDPLLERIKGNVLT